MSKSQKKSRSPRKVLRIPDLEQPKNAVTNSLPACANAISVRKSWNYRPRVTRLGSQRSLDPLGRGASTTRSSEKNFGPQTVVSVTETIGLILGTMASIAGKMVFRTSTTGSGVEKMVSRLETIFLTPKTVVGTTNAKVETTNAKVETTNAMVETTNAKVETTNAMAETTNILVETKKTMVGATKTMVRIDRR
jgi:hypothetical protein